MRTPIANAIGPAVLIAATPTYSRTWHINLDRTGDAPTIQAGIDSSAVGDTVPVAPGTYTRADQDMLDYTGRA